jgi:hypothetical protein
MYHTRLYFNKLMAKYPCTSKYLAPDAKIVKFPHLESALVKLTTPTGIPTGSLTREELKELRYFKKPAPQGNLSFTEEARRDAGGNYTDLKPFKGNNSIVERFFSLYKHYVSVLRARLTLENIEKLLFLRVNSDYWSKRDVQHATLQFTPPTREQKSIEELKRYYSSMSYLLNSMLLIRRRRSC